MPNCLRLVPRQEESRYLRKERFNCSKKKNYSCEHKMDNHEIVKHPLATEKVIRLMEAENKLVFVVDKRATKPEIKKAIEELFKAKVKAINTLNSVTGEK